MPRLMLFDLDNTLLDRVDVFRRWASDWVSGRGLEPASALPWLEQADGDGMVARPTFFAAVKEHFELAESVEELRASYDRDYPAFVRPAPGPVREALSEARRHGYRVGIVTNGPASQTAKIARMDFGELVDGWAVSALVGANKPSPAIFRAAAAACGVDCDDWSEGGWMVGDNAEADIGGGQACELRSAWIDRGRPWPQGLPEPDLVAANVEEAVASILERG